MTDRSPRSIARPPHPAGGPAGRRLGAVAVLFVAGALIGAPACSRYTLESGEPEIELSASSIEFGEIQRGTWYETSVAVFNQGTATLEVLDYVMQDGSSDAFYFEDPQREIVPGAFAELSVRYTPTHEGADAGAILIYSNDADETEVALFLQGVGVLPRAAVEPALLYFPIDEGTQTQTFELASVGSGALTVTQARLDDEVAEFDVTFPAGYEPPVELAPGLAIDVGVTYTPSDGEGRQDVLLLSTNDPERPAGIVEVELVAAGEPPDGENHAPIVEIVSPGEGHLFAAGSMATITGQVADLEDPPSALGILWHSDRDGYLTGGAPAADGEVLLQTDTLSHGIHAITLKAFDSEGEEASDLLHVQVFEEAEELEYTLSGGDTPFHYFHVDDDLLVELNGHAVFVDEDGHQDHHPPLTFFAQPGDTLRIVATDEQYCTQAIDALQLHLGQYQQPLNAASCVSACEEHDSYDPTFEGPWPNVFVDETHTISIP